MIKNILSIIIPCYNVEKYIGGTIDSLKKQKRQDIEFLFVNDGSTDGTKAIIEEFASSDNRVKLIDQTNGGVSAARNAALAVATGDYIYLLDGDDYLTDNATDAMISYLQFSQCDMLLSNIWFVKKARKTLYRHKLKEGIYTPERLYSKCVIFPLPPQNIYKREIITANVIQFNEKIKAGEVYEFTAHFLNHAHQVYVVDDSFAHYVMRSSSATHKINHGADRSVITLAEALYQYNAKFANYFSFHITAFKLITSFTYSKYLRQGCFSPEISETIGLVFQNRTVCQCVKKVAFTFHFRLKERLLAWYILMFRKNGFYLAIKIRNILYAK